MSKIIRLTHEGHTYGLHLEGRDSQVTLRGEKDGVAFPQITAVVQTLGPWLLIQMDGRSYRGMAVKDKDGVWVSIDGRTCNLKFKSAGGRSDAAALLTSTEVRAPMTGTVSRIEVEPGITVVHGDLLAVMEAMKMEYRLEAQMNGKVDRVHCRPGDLVDLGALLIELSPVPPA